MKFLDKVKNMFTEVVEEEPKNDEVVVEQIVTKNKKNDVSPEEFNQVKVPEVKKEEKKPVFFTDDDFNDLDDYFNKNTSKTTDKKSENKKKKDDSIEYTRSSIYADKELPGYNPVINLKSSNTFINKDTIDVYKINTAEGENESSFITCANEYLEKYNEENGGVKEPYQGNIKVEVKTHKFKPTPIISPVYGILDKNYHKEDIVSKNDTEYKSIDGLSVDSIREKAYGSLEDELENTLFGSNSILFKDDKKKDNNKYDNFFDDIEDEIASDDSNLRDLENITMDIGKELDTLLNKDTNSTANSEKKSSNDVDDDDLFNLIDTMYEGDEKYDD